MAYEYDTGSSGDAPGELRTRGLYGACRGVNISNIYHTEGSCDGRMSLPLMVGMLVLGFITFFVNLGVIIRTIKILRRNHDNKPAFYFIGNLALSDLAIGLYVIIAFLLHMTNRGDLWQQQTCTLQIAVAVTACQETIFTIVLIAVDKYLYICHGLKYHQIVTGNRVFIAVSLSWVLSLIIGWLPAMGMKMSWEESCSRCAFPQVISPSFSVIFFITSVAVPYAVVVTLYTILLVLAIKMQKSRYGGTYSGRSSNRSTNFRLSLMSKKSSKSVRSTVTTTSSVGGTPSKLERRRMRRKALEEQKSKLPLIAYRSISEEEGEMKRVAEKREEDKGDRHLEDGGRRQESEALVKEERERSPQLGVIGRSVAVEEEVDEAKEDTEIGEETEGYIGEEEETGETYLTEEQEEEEEKEEQEEGNEEEQQKEGANKDDDGEKEEQPPTEYQKEGETSSVKDTPPPTETTPKPEGQTPTDITQVSPPSKEEENGNITKNEDESSDEGRTFLFTKYFNRVVSDTRDKVLFLKKCRAVKTVILIIGSFTCTYVPFVVGSMVYSLQEDKKECLLHALNTLLYCGVVANSLANPMLYAYGYREFRLQTKRFKGVFARERTRIVR